MRLALFEPDISQNTGTILRLAACLSVPTDIIEPCGFVLSDKRFQRAGLDYLAHAVITRHRSWAAFRRARTGDPAAGRLVLLTTKAPTPYIRFAFLPGDTLLLGREGAGVPAVVHAVVDARVRIPIVPGRRSLNVAIAAAMILGEGLRQTGGFATDAESPTSHSRQPGKVE